MASPYLLSPRENDVEKATGKLSTSPALSTVKAETSTDGLLEMLSSKLSIIAEQARKATLRGSQKHSTISHNRKRKDVISRRTHKFHLDEDDILEHIQDHRECNFGTVRLRGLAKFDDFMNCGVKGISESKEKQLLRDEVKKLMECARSDGHLLYSSKGSLHATTLEGYTNLSNLADQIRCNYNIIKHDNSRIILENCPEASFEAINHFKKSRKVLLGRFAQDKHHVEGREPVTLSNSENNVIAYHTLVDFILGIMAWWIVRTADGINWRNQLLAILAQWAAKLKVVAIDPRRCAERALEDGEELMRQMIADLETKDIFVIKVKSFGSSEKSDRKMVDVLDEESDMVSTYYTSRMIFREKLENILYWILNFLQEADFTNTAIDSFEVSTLVYKTGLDRTLTLLNGDRDGDISATSKLYHISRNYTAFLLLFGNTEILKGKLNEPTDHDTEVKWHQSRSADTVRSDVSKLRTSSMDDIISLLVPLALTAAIPSRDIGELIQIMTVMANQEDLLAQFEPPPRDFQAEFTISTSEWLNKRQRLQHGRYHDPDILPLSVSPLKRGIRAGTELARLMSKDADDKAPTVAETRASKILEDCERHTKVMDKWIVAESSITVDCRLYSRAALGVAVLLVLGSMSVPFTVGNRISGVDPFQITTFVWLLAGFLLVGAKSRYVSDWPWHDFLRGQVICRSLSELTDVSGVDAQMILLYLLHNEYKNTLVVKGPYTGMFKRVPNTGYGFIIDEAVQLSTMLASGFAIFKVLNEKGEHLVCIDVRKGASTRQIISGHETKYNAVMDIGRDDLEDESSEEDIESESLQGSKRAKSARKTANQRADKVLMLQREEFRWNTMLGLYVKDSRFG